MLSITRSHCFFGRNQHTCGPAAYLSTLVATGVADVLLAEPTTVLRRIEEAMSVAAASNPVPDPLRRHSPPAATGTWNATLPAAIIFVIGRVCDAIGVHLLTVRQLGCSARDDEIAFLLTGEDAEAVRRAGVLSIGLMNLVLTADAEPGSWDRGLPFIVDQVGVLGRFAASRRPSLTEAAIIAVARERGIPIILLDRWPIADDSAEPKAKGKPGLQLGWGVHGRRLHGSASDGVSPRVYGFLMDRQITRDQLARHGIPVPAFDHEFPGASSARRAVARAERLGYPVVLKARYRSSGSASMANLNDHHAVAKAYGALTDESNRDVVIERHVTGDCHRVLVIGNEVVAVRRFLPAGASVPGACPVARPPVTIESDALSAHWKDIVASAAKAFGLPIATVDLITLDITASGSGASGAVVGVNPIPDLGHFSAPGEAIPQAAARRLLDHLFPRSANGRISICAITGTNGKTTTSRMVAKILSLAGRRVGLACTDGVYIDGERVFHETASGIAGALTVFLNRSVDCAVLETSRGTLVTKGLAFEHCDVAGCTYIAKDHLGEDGIETLAQMARVKRTVVEAATDCAVLNADDSLCLEMLPSVNARMTYLVSRAETSAVVDAHVARGGNAVVLRQEANGDSIVVRTLAGVQPVLRTDQIPAAWQGAAQHNIDNAMFATAFALAFGTQISTIRAALSTFTSSIEETPGRLNVYDKLPFKVVLDFAHNVHGLQALCNFVRQLDHNGRRYIVAYWTRSSPRAPDLAEAMETIARCFDRFICRDAAGTAEEGVGAVSAQLEAALLGAGVAREAVQVIPNFTEAVNAALESAKPGDLVTIITGSKAPLIWQQVDQFRARFESAQDS